MALKFVDKERVKARMELWKNIFGVLLRVCFFPLIILAELVYLPFRVKSDESMNYDEVVNQKRKAAPEEFPKFDLLKQASTSVLDTLGVDEKATRATLVFSRFKSTFNNSFWAAYQIFVYNVCVGIGEILGLSKVTLALQGPTELFLSKYFTPGLYTTRNGKKVPYSLVNVMQPDFTLPYTLRSAVSAAGFPHSCKVNEARIDSEGDYVDDATNNLFFLMLSKLAYEYPALIYDVIDHKYNLAFELSEMYHKGMHSSNHEEIAALDYRPDTYAFAASNPSSIFIVFRGTQPLNLVNWATDANFAFKQNDLGGVHAGFYKALFDSPESVFDTLVDLLHHPRNEKKSIYIAGHSLGAALSSVFALALRRNPDLFHRVKGVYTYGQPRTGDQAYCDNFNDAFLHRCLRFVHSVDIVPKAPAGFGYRHHCNERYITSDDTILKDEKEIQLRRLDEDFFGLMISIKNILRSPKRGESVLRFVSRFVLFFVPSMSAHFTSDYEYALRRQIDLGQ